jgi:hypothetical protein
MHTDSAQYHRTQAEISDISARLRALQKLVHQTNSTD